MDRSLEEDRPLQSKVALGGPGCGCPRAPQLSEHRRQEGSRYRREAGYAQWSLIPHHQVLALLLFKRDTLGKKV